MNTPVEEAGYIFFLITLFCKNIYNGQNPVNEDCMRFKDTNQVNKYQ